MAGHIVPYLRTTGAALLLALLAGCQSKTTTGANAADRAGETLASSSAEREQMALCFKQLEALKAIRAGQSAALEAEFTQLMAGAAKYASVRGNISALNQDTVDAFYRFRANLLCSKIDGSLLATLSERDEQPQ